MSNDIPRSWHPYLERKGIPVSYRGLSAKAGLSHEAARRVIRGWSVRQASITLVADALGIDPEVVRELRGEAPSQVEPWEPPAVSSLLSHDEREALSRLISLMTAQRGSDGDGDAATNTHAGTRPAKVVQATAETGAELRRGEGQKRPRAPRRRGQRRAAPADTSAGTGSAPEEP